ncbi:MAG: ribosome biogenesis GTPase Der [Verrucomicrobia bacterium]|nr:ribosome biogenesis GTPase Der [Verrucomicrobiota bacterium]
MPSDRRADPPATANPRTVAIVGRPNVGKSALFNRLAGEFIAIVHDQPGITRDRIVAECRLGAAPFDIIDTGGIGEVADEQFADRVRSEAELAVAAASLVLLVVDGRAGLQNADADLAKYLRRQDVPVLLVVNKLDQSKHNPLVADFARLGFDNPVSVSAAHGRGIPELVARVEAQLPEPVEVEETDEDAEELDAKGRPKKRRVPRVAIIGRPNVGKSSLTNAILKDDRTIVSEISGTTRDAIDIPHVFNGKRYVLIDTAGIRHRGRHKTSAEVFSVMRSEKSIERADVCVLVIDGAEGVTRMDRTIGGLVQKAGKPVVLVVNKWDLVEKGRGEKAMREFRKEFLEAASADLFFLAHAPIVATTAIEKRGAGKVFQAVENLRASAATPTPTGPLNRLLQQAIERQPPPTVALKRFKLLYVTRAPDEAAATPVPIPRFIFFCNDPALLTDSYRRYLEMKIREEYGFAGLPLSIRLRGRAKAE